MFLASIVTGITALLPLLFFIMCAVAGTGTGQVIASGVGALVAFAITVSTAFYYFHQAYSGSGMI